MNIITMIQRHVKFIVKMENFSIQKLYLVNLMLIAQMGNFSIVKQSSVLVFVKKEKLIMNKLHLVKGKMMQLRMIQMMMKLMMEMMVQLRLIQVIMKLMMQMMEVMMQMMEVMMEMMEEMMEMIVELVEEVEVQVINHLKKKILLVHLERLK